MKLAAITRPRQLSDVNWAWALATGILAASVAYGRRGWSPLR